MNPKNRQVKDGGHVRLLSRCSKRERLSGAPPLNLSSSYLPCFAIDRSWKHKKTTQLSRDVVHVTDDYPSTVQYNIFAQYNCRANCCNSGTTDLLYHET